MKCAIAGLLYGCFLCLAAPARGQECLKKIPLSFSLKEATACSATLKWSAGAGTQTYKLSYRESGKSGWSTSYDAGSELEYTFTGLKPGVSYEFRIFSKCADGSKSPYARTTATLPVCSAPFSVVLKEQKARSLQFAVESSCSFDSLRVQYSQQDSPAKILVLPEADLYEIPGLNHNTSYVFTFSACSGSVPVWSAADTFETAVLPNVLLIIMDDGRFDYLSINGAPSFFQTPNIDRIGTEGINFRNAYVASSLCAPSRSSMATGLFTTHTGVYDNKAGLDVSFHTVPEVLRDHGYYTAFIGKNHDVFKMNEFHYYLETTPNAKHFNCNGDQVVIDKLHVLALTDTALKLVKETEDPFFLWLAYKVPHVPHEPLDHYSDVFDGQAIPWEDDTAQYKLNYPSFIYQKSGQMISGEDRDTTYLNALEDMAGLDSCIGLILDTLESAGKLDNTLVIFVSDNGYMMGSHYMQYKTHSFERSIHVPLLMRYPKWFNGEPATTDFASNMDIAPTIYEAAEVTTGQPIDGISLRRLQAGEVNRKEFYYLMVRDMNDDWPTERAYMDQNFKYIRYHCSDTVEMLFDRVNDPYELVNLVNNEAFESVLNACRLKMDSAQIAWHDTLLYEQQSCWLENPYYEKKPDEMLTTAFGSPRVFPNPVANILQVFIPWETADVELRNTTNQKIAAWKLGSSLHELPLPPLASGCYFVAFSNGTQRTIHKVVVER